MATCSIVEDVRRFRGAYSLHHQDNTYMFRVYDFCPCPKPDTVTNCHLKTFFISVNIIRSIFV
jgi:hypothetical protein